MKSLLRLGRIFCISGLLFLLTGCGGSGSEEDHFVFEDENQTIATNPNPPAADPVDSTDSTTNDPVAKAPATTSGSGEFFVWKPVSEADGNAVILLPATSSAGEMRLFGPFGEEAGDYQGRTNGGRPTFRFNLPGCAYSPYVETESDDGDHYFIESPCNRLEF